MSTVTNHQASWDHRRPSFGGTSQNTLPPIASLNGSSPGSDPRDSGNWSMTGSQRASNISEISQPPLTLPPIEPSRNSPGEPSHHGYPQQHSPITAGFGNAGNSLHGASPGHYAPPNEALPTPSPSASRRSSFDARLGRLDLSSPIGGTPSASQVSLNSTLLNTARDSHGLTTQISRERGIHSNSPHPPHGHESPHAPSNPFGHRPPDSGIYAAVSRAGPIPGRTAPPIAPIKHGYGQANAPVPTKGMPWAFPDPDLASVEESRASHEGGMHGRNSTSSLPGSAASSIYSSNSGIVPQGHMPSVMDMNGSHLPRTSLPSLGQDTHHHGLAGRRPSIISAHDGSHATPYSRTPELRVSHKLAERKRRKEMKDLFDELRDSLPAERGGKSSKWEVLTKAIEYVQHQKNQLLDREQKIEQMRIQIEQYQKDLEAARQEVQHYRGQHQHNMGYRNHPPPPAPQEGRMQGLESCP